VVKKKKNGLFLRRNLVRKGGVHSEVLTAKNRRTKHARKIRVFGFRSDTHDYLSFVYFYLFVNLYCEPGSSVGITTELRGGRSGIEFRRGRDFPPVQTGPGFHPASCKMGTGSFSG